MGECWVLFGKYRIKYILSLLNSKLFNYVYKKIGKEKGGLLEFYTEPLYSIKKNDNNSIQTHDRLVSLVDSMLETQKEFHNAKSDNDKELFKQKIDIIDRQIDGLVYGLYGLNKDDIKVIEAGL
jgi:hypothetical protein